MRFERLAQALRLLAVALFSISLLSCGTGDGEESVEASAADVVAAKLELVFRDDFGGPAVGAIPASPKIAARIAPEVLPVGNWVVETGYGSNNDGWGNDEWQRYDNSMDNLFTEDGSLVIRARCTAAACGKRDDTITSAKITTKNRLNVRYGNIKARIKMPSGLGMWPAFWTLGSDIDERPWPDAGEIDIVEMHYFYSDTRTTHFATHWGGPRYDSTNRPVCSSGVAAASADEEENCKSSDEPLPKTFDFPLTDDFHVYELDWNENSLVGKIDGIAYFTQSIDAATMEEFLKDHYLILNVAVGGNLGGPFGPSMSAADWADPDQTDMLVDWVEVYEKVPASNATLIDESGNNLVYNRIINSAEFNGAFVESDLDSTAVTPLVGSTVLELVYSASISENGGVPAGFSGAIFDFNNIDLSSFTKVVFSIDISQFPEFDHIGIQFEDSQNGVVLVSTEDYMPTAITGGWETYEIPLSDFAGVDLNDIVRIGFFNPLDSSDKLIAGTLYVDDIRFETEECTVAPAVSFDSVNYNPATTSAVVNVDDICGASKLAVIKVETDDGEIFVGAKLDAAGQGSAAFSLISPASSCSSDDETGVLSLVGGLQATYTRNFFDADGTPQFVTASAAAGIDSSVALVEIFGESLFMFSADGLALNWLPDTDFNFDDFGSGAQFDGGFVDTTFAQAVAVSGNAGAAALLAFNNFDSGFDALFKSLNFKAKNMPGDVIRIKLGDTGVGEKTFDLTTYSGSTDIGDGWFSVKIPLTEFPETDHSFVMWGSNTSASQAYTFLVTDMFFEDSPPSAGGECAAPTTPAPTPTRDIADVVSLFSNAYTDVPVDTWAADFGSAVQSDTDLNGDDLKAYVGLGFAAIEATTTTIDASAMTHLHIDVWTPNMQNLLIKLVDFGGDGFGGNADTEGSVTSDLTAEEWTGLDIPLTSFTGLSGSRDDIAQIIFDGSGDMYIDNLYFYAGGPVVNDLPFSDDFESGDLAGWDVSTVGGTITADNTQASAGTWSANLVVGPTQTAALKLSNLGIGQVMPGDLIDISFDICGVAGSGGEIQPALLSEETIGGAAFRDNLGNIGSPPSVWTRQTYSDRVVAANVNGGITLQLDAVCGGDGACEADVYIDNVSITINGGDLGSAASGLSCVGVGGGPTEPPVAAPILPALNAASVISLFSDSYPDVTVDTWRTSWSAATLDESFVVDGSANKLYTGLDFVGIEFAASPVDASAMTHLHLDLWTPDDVSGGELFRVKLVNFGSGGNTEFEIAFSSASTQPLATGTWVSLDIPLAEFIGLSGTETLAQLILSGTLGGGAGLGTVYLDNVYFYDSAGGFATEPPVAAPTPPARDTADVKSLFSDAYTDETVDTWRTSWSAATLDESFVVDGSANKLYTGLDFVGIEFAASPVDASAMTHLHLDLWTPDDVSGGELFRVKLVNFGSGGNTEFEIAFSSASTQPLATGTWVSLDIPLADFTGLSGTETLAQLILSGTLGGGAGLGTVYIDNVYFYTGGGGSSALVNGDFETGDFTGWTQTPDAGTNVTPGTITLVTSAPGSRAGAVARLEAAGDGIAGSQDVLLTQVLAAGTLNVGDTIDVSFDLYGSLAGAGGVVFVELIYLDVGGVDTGIRSFVDGGAPKVPTTTWSTYSDSIVVPAGDVSGGVKLQLKSSCGPVDGCGVDAYFDNVTATITP